MTSNYLWNNPEEVDAFEQTVGKFLSQQIDPERFMAFRLQHGVYGQRQEGVHMVRVKVPGGRLYSHQLPTLSNILSNYCDTSHASISTRQDIQFHFVKLEDTPSVLKELGQADLTSREACGNTVRNITACTLSGVCPKQLTDVTPYAEAVAQHFIRHPLTQHLPRKFKMSFSACGTDCAMGLMHDVGIVAVQKDNTFGFKLLAAGGLGHKPRQAICLADFLQTSELIPAIEALVTLHNRYSDRKRRAKARIKFLLDKFGEEAFKKKFFDELNRTKEALRNLPVIDSTWSEPHNSDTIFSDGSPRGITPQRQTGYVSIPIHLPLGQINAQQLSALHQLMQDHNLTELRTTSDQNLVLINVANKDAEQIINRLQQHEFKLPSRGDNIIACPGTATCRLGITASRTIAGELNNPADLRLRVSGCHNSCGQHHVADIGLHGEGKRIQGKLIPSYTLHLGGQGTTQGQIAIKGPTIPTQRAQAAVMHISQAYLEDNTSLSFTQWVHSKPDYYFDQLLHDFTHIDPEHVKELARDVGENENFRVLQLGGGECAGAAQDHVASNFSEAIHERNYCSAFYLQRKYEEALECARQTVLLTGVSVLFLAGAKAKESLEELVDAYSKILCHRTDLIEALNQLNQQLTELNRDFIPDAFEQMTIKLDKWIQLTANTCQEMDEQLDLATPGLDIEQAASAENIIELDLSSYECPLHYVKARNELRKLASEQLVRLILEDEEALRQVSSSLKKEGHDILDNEPVGEFVALMVKRKK